MGKLCLELPFQNLIKGNFYLNSIYRNRDQICPHIRKEQKTSNIESSGFKTFHQAMKDTAPWKMRHKWGESCDHASLLHWKNFQEGEQGGKVQVRLSRSSKAMHLRIWKARHLEFIEQDIRKKRAKRTLEIFKGFTINIHLTADQCTSVR